MRAFGPIARHVASLPKGELDRELALLELKRTTVALMSTSPFFASLVLRLRREEDPSLNSAMSTDGTTLWYSPQHILDMQPEHRASLLAIQVARCAAGQPWRRGSRDPEPWDRAGEYAVTPIIKDAGMVLPPGALYQERFRNHSAEQIYRILKREEQEQEDQGPEGQPSPVSHVTDAPKDKEEGQQPGSEEGGSSGSGEDMEGNSDAPTDDPSSANGGSDEAPASPPPLTEHDWQTAVLQSEMAARKRGSMPASAELLIDAVRNPPEDWRAITRQFVQEAAQSDYDWTIPARRYMPLGLLLPSRRSRKLGTVVVVADTSGSVLDVLPAFGAHMAVIHEEAEPEQTIVLYVDAGVQRAEYFEPGETFAMHAKGGGGTDFRPAFAWVEEHEVQPACLIYLTDLDGRFPEQAPDYPVLWAVSEKIKEPPPFGESIEITADGA